MMVKGEKQKARDSNGSDVRYIQVKIKNLMDEHKVMVDVKIHGSEPALESVSVLDKRPFSCSMFPSTKTHETPLLKLHQNHDHYAKPKVARYDSVICHHAGDVSLKTLQTDGGNANYIGSDICVNSIPTISTRDDPDLERMLKEKARWGDPMTHFVKEGKPVATYVLHMNGYVDQLEHLGYMLPQDLVVCLILNGLTKDFVGFMRNYNMHNMGKTISELHAMLIEYENGLPKKAETPHVMMIKGGKIQKAKKNRLKLKARVNLMASNSIYEIDMHDLVPNDNSIYSVITKRAKHNLDSTYLWHCHLAHISKKRIEKLQQEGFLRSTDDESFDQCVSCLSGKMTRKSFPRCPERATNLLGIIYTDVCGPLRHVSRQGASYFITFTDDYSRYGYVYLLKHKHEVFEMFKVFKNEVVNQLRKTIKALRSDRESATRILNMVPTKKVDKTPYGLCKIPVEVEGFEPPQEEVIPIRRSKRTHRAPNRLCLNVEVGDLNEPASYKAAMLDSKSNKWIDAMNAEIQSMIDNMVWVLVDLPPNCKTVRSKSIFMKKTGMDGIVHTYKACLLAKGYTQLYGVDYEEMFSPVADIRAIRILMSIAAFYDYEIW
nr:retrotransposon protein, putative, Ty1-copia subclass [Tanacetum cinerariifolium]